MTKLRRKPSLLFVELNRNRHGRVRFYFRKDRDAERVRLPDDPKSVEFKAAYQACLAGVPLPAISAGGAIAPRTPPKSFGWLIKLYLDSVAFKTSYGATTQATRRRQLEKLGRESAAVPLSKIDRLTIQATINARREVMHEANSLLTTLKNMFDWAMAELITDPASGETIKRK